MGFKGEAKWMEKKLNFIISRLLVSLTISGRTASYGIRKKEHNFTTVRTVCPGCS